MAISDGSIRSLELWNDGPAVQALLGQMQSFQAQMQQQLQEQVAHIQQQVGSLQRSPQPAHGLQVPFWPVQQVLPQMPFQPAGRAPAYQRTRASRMGKRERAGLKAARSTHQAKQVEQKNEGSEAEASGDSWQPVHAGDAARESPEKIGVETMHHLMTEFGKTLKTEMEDGINEFKKSFDNMLSAAIEKLVGVVCECKTETGIALARLKTDLKADFVNTFNSAIEAASSSFQLPESERVSKKADVELRIEALASKQLTMATELKGLMPDEMRSVANKIDAVDSSLQNLRSDIEHLQALNSELSHRNHQPLEEMRSNMKKLQESVDRICAAVDIISDGSAKASKTVQVQDAIVQCDDAEGQGVGFAQNPKVAADSFDLCAKGTDIVIANGGLHVTHSGLASSHTWATVYGKHLVEHGKYEWQLAIESSRRSGQNTWQMIVGVASTPTNKNHFLSSKDRGLGYIPATGCKTNGHSSKAYAQGYASGDVVTIVLDMGSRQLSFKKNQQEMGFSHTVSSGPYRLAVSLGSREHAVRLLAPGPL